MDEMTDKIHSGLATKQGTNITGRNVQNTGSNSKHRAAQERAGEHQMENESENENVKSEHVKECE